MPHRNLSRGGSHGALAFYSGAQRGSPKVAGTRRAAPRPFRRALSYQALEAVLRRGTVPAEDAGSDQSERPLGRDRAHAAANHRNLRPRHRQASELRGGVITSLRCRVSRSDPVKIIFAMCVSDTTAITARSVRSSCRTFRSGRSSEQAQLWRCGREGPLERTDGR
jgi:hypothetical protein